MKLALKPASWPWLLRHEIRLLLRHEIRLQWRATGGARLWLVASFGGLLYAALHFAAWGGLRGSALVETYPPIAIAIAGLVPWLMMSLILSQAIMMSVTALFDRGDLDLLLSSPLSPRTVFTVRGLGIATGCIMLYSLLLTPLAHMGALTGRPNLLAIYPVLMSMGLLVTAIGLFITLTLVRTIGARRARVAAQLLGALVGAALFLATQLQNLLGTNLRGSMTGWLTDAAQPGGMFATDGFLLFPLRALLGDPVSTLSFVAMSVGAFLLVINLLHQRFLSGTQESTTGKSHISAAASPRIVAHFKNGKHRFARTVLVKEWKLLWRDPQLLAQTFLQLLYLLPLIFVAFRRNADLSLIVPSTIFLATSLAGSLAWITVAAEDAPELIAGAPVNIAHIRWLKALAALIPVWILVLPIFLFLCSQNLIWALIFFVCMAASTASAGMSQIMYPRSGDRKNMKQRAKGNMVINLLEALGSFGWGGVAYCLMIAPSPLAWFGLLALAVALSAPAAAWVLGRARRNGDAVI